MAPGTPPDYDPAGDTQKSVDAVIDEVKSALPSVPIQSTVVEGHPARVLVEKSQGAELLVVGSRGHGEFPGMLLGSVSQHCATGAHSRSWCSATKCRETLPDVRDASGIRTRGQALTWPCTS